ncbi:glycosyltransferase [Congregicoccus parvus]|uniref:glycosyltransferase n=1 Tax=Congregicoccus parvus TaxID=3081749 RepID=UPI003FA58E6D
MSALSEHFDRVVSSRRRWDGLQEGFRTQLQRRLAHHVPAGSRVLELGSGTGRLLESLGPTRGLGIDFSAAMVAAARERSRDPKCEYRHQDVLFSEVAEGFDHIVMDYLIGYLPDIQPALERIKRSAHARTRLHIHTLNTPWRLFLRWAEGLGVVRPQPPSNWLSHEDLQNLLELAGWEVVRKETLQFLPFDVPLLTPLLNRVMVRLPILRDFGMTVAIVARPKTPPRIDGPISCTVVVPARNEAGNIRAALERIPVLGTRTEIVFVEGNSTDDTWDVIQREVAAYAGPHEVRAIRQPGKGKWDAVRAGFAIARGDVLVIQDADLTAPPEDLVKFYDAIESGAAEFANGSRLVYPMESKAMRFLNLLGNHFFARALSYVIGQSVKDSLCGTKMMLRTDYLRAMERIRRFGDFDPFGDFNLLFGSALIDLRIRDIPVRYRDRTYGETNISRFSHGWMLLKMVWFGLWKLKWV